MRIPKKFKVAGLTITVKDVEYIGDGYVYGDFSDCTQEIRLAKKYFFEGKWINISKDLKLRVFLHELVHCFNYYFNSDTDEALAQTFSSYGIEYLQTAEYDEEK